MGTGLSSLGSLEVRAFLGFRVGPEQCQLNWEWWSHTSCVLKSLLIWHSRWVRQWPDLICSRPEHRWVHRDCLALNLYSPPTCCAVLNNIPSLSEPLDYPLQRRDTNKREDQVVFKGWAKAPCHYKRLWMEKPLCATCLSPEAEVRDSCTSGMSSCLGRHRRLLAKFQVLMASCGYSGSTCTIQLSLSVSNSPL